MIYDSEQIKGIIPHRDPILLVDAVHRLEREKSIIASRKLTADQLVFNGHFPGNPIYPGVYMIEGMAQTAAILLFDSFYSDVPIEERPTGFFSSVEDVRFKKMVTIGDELRYEVSLTKHKSAFYWFEGKTVNCSSEDVVASGNFSVAIVPKKS